MSHELALPSDGCRRALRALAESARLAADVQAPAWQFALELQALGQVGAGPSELRWLIAKGLVECELETTRSEGVKRMFLAHKSLSLPPNACFVLTELGRRTADLLRDGGTESTVKPRWDRDRRQLWLGDKLVKAFRVPAPNQEAILAAFDELGWPSRIDDPLPNRGKDGDIRLRDTIKALNAAQGPGAIRFLADGTGRGVVWRREEDGTRSLDLPWIARGKADGEPQ